MIVKLLTEHHLEFLSLTGGYTGSSEFTLVKMTHCWKLHVEGHFTKHCKPRVACSCELSMKLEDLTLVLMFY